jgi:hypothetical protein
MPVLTMFAPQIATGTSEAQPGVTRDKMIKGCLFNRPNIYDRGFPINNGIEFPFLVFSVSTESPFPIADNTLPRTKEALDSGSMLSFIKQCLLHFALTVLHVLSIIQINAIENRDSDH